MGHKNIWVQSASGPVGKCQPLLMHHAEEQKEFLDRAQQLEERARQVESKA